MAQRVVVTLSDDIDGGEAAETVIFALDGKTYEIDLNPANARKLRKTLAPYVAAGRKQSNAAKHGRKPAAYQHTSLAPDPAAVRAWARSHRMEVPPGPHPEEGLRGVRRGELRRRAVRGGPHGSAVRTARAGGRGRTARVAGPRCTPHGSAAAGTAVRAPGRVGVASVGGSPSPTPPRRTPRQAAPDARRDGHAPPRPAPLSDPSRALPEVGSASPAGSRLARHPRRSDRVWNTPRGEAAKAESHAACGCSSVVEHPPSRGKAQCAIPVTRSARLFGPTTASDQVE